MTIHGESYRNKGTPEYRSWYHMKRRCKSDPHYISRGILVCDEWINNYPQFLQDMGRKPTPNHSIDRINNEEGYYPTNCRWSDKTTQQRNQRQSRWVTINGERIHLVELSKQSGVSYSTLRERFNRGFRGEDILNHPSFRRRK